MIITEILARNARMYGNETALIVRDPQSGRREEISWRQFDEMANQFIEEYSASNSHRMKRQSLHYWVVNRLAEFFKVSKQSSEIRLDERGYCLRE